jgi:hypothetical protein
MDQPGFDDELLFDNSTYNSDGYTTNQNPTQIAQWYKKNDVVLIADRGNTGDPLSGQRILYLPNEGVRYRIIQNQTINLDLDIDYTLSGKTVTLLNGDIMSGDRFKLCEY